MNVFLQKSIRLDSGSPLLLKSISYHLNHRKYPFGGAQKPFFKCGELSEIHFLGFVKTFRTSIFLSISEGLLLNIPETRSSLLWIFIFSISHFSSLETMYRSSRLQLFFNMGVLKNFAIFTGKHLCWSLFLIKPSGLQLY